MPKLYISTTPNGSNNWYLKWQIQKSLEAKMPIRKFTITNEEELQEVMQYAKTYLKQKLKLNFKNFYPE